MHAPPKSSIPVIDAATLQKYDAFLFGIPTRYGNFPAQWKAFWDTTGGQWASGGYSGKYAGVFVSTGTPGGGQESTVIASLSTLAHHGIIYVPLGYKHSFAQLSNISEVRGGSPWGAGTFAVSQACFNAKSSIDTNFSSRVLMDLANPQLWNWNLPRFTASLLVRLSPKSTSDYMAPTMGRPIAGKRKPKQPQ